MATLQQLETAGYSVKGARFAAMVAAKALKEAGYKGEIYLRPSEGRVELLAAHPSWPRRWLHHTWTPSGHHFERFVAQDLEAAKAAIEV